ncbi:conserved hypothetical protein [Paecilomyces variotii No. 5]|uniref:NACHT domain-containing protein n=1 Tax=Byssochlamys spectabilis (strain No. 5 / NBRC 109023) TaxID=1356009 RepID=V5FW80_BYSSN|nr:conserved hypothetical protein [Paecilomyces variotii No. 5]
MIAARFGLTDMAESGVNNLRFIGWLLVETDIVLMDPITAVGLASSILTFVEFAGKCVKGAYEIYNSELGSAADNSRSKELLGNIVTATDTLDSHFCGISKNEKSLREICKICHQQSDKLQRILGELTVTEKDSKWQSLKVSFKSMRKETKEEITSIERSLDSCRLQTLTWMGIIFSEQQSSLNKKLDDILKGCQRVQSDRTLEISNLLAELRETIQIAWDREQKSTSTTVQVNAESVVDPCAHIISLLPKLQMMVQSIPYENYVLRRLYFTDMYLREDDIKPAEDGTYLWIVEDEENNDEGFSNIERDMRQLTRNSFLTWLRSGGSVYHVCGKIGSGKSTLMKYLCGSPCVQKELESWAEGKKLIFARFFFWNSGSRIQMSMEGLYRALLFEALKKCPELIQQVFPEQWDLFDTEKNHNHLSENIPFRMGEVKAALERLVDRKCFPNHRLCFFIDGLDEYEGESLEHWELARSLQKWAQSQDIKICVSSRPHTEFMETFSDDLSHRIRLHELTQGDMDRFCRSAFEKDVMFDRIRGVYEELVTEIVRRAEGVFLWVVLVVRSLLSGMKYYDPPSVLRERLDRIPKTLDRLFESLIESIEPGDRRRSDTMLLLATTFPLERHNALLYSWLDDVNDMDFPFNTAMRGYSDEEIAQAHRKVRIHLDSLTKGLLEMKPVAHADTFMKMHNDIYFHYDVGFLHRSVREYLQSTSQLSNIKNRLQGIDFTDIYCRLLLAQSKFPRLRLYTENSSLFLRDNLVYSFEWFAGLHIAGKEPPVKIMEEFSEILEGYGRLSSIYAQRGSEGESKDRGLHVYISGSPAITGKDISFIHFAAVFRQNQFVFQKTVTSPDMLETKDGLNLLLSAALSGNSELVYFLLERGASMNERVETKPMATARKTGRDAPTVWLSFVLHFAVSVIEKREKWIWQDSLKTMLEAPLSQYGLILEYFLRFGANTEVCFILYEASAESNGELKPALVSLQQFINAMRPPNFEAMLQFFRGRMRSRIFKKIVSLISKKDLSSELIASAKEILDERSGYKLDAAWSKDGGCEATDRIRLY